MSDAPAHNDEGTMGTVADRVREIEQQQRRDLAREMSPQLALFLETCWAFRKNVNLKDSHGKLDIYLLYCGRVHQQVDRPDGWGPGASQDLQRFFEGLTRIKSVFEIGIQPYGMLGDLYEYFDEDALPKSGMDSGGRGMMLRILNNAQRMPESWGPVLWDLGMSFFFFHRSTESAMRRVYLNVTPKCRLLVCDFLARAFTDVPEVGRFKVLGPLQKGHDTFVIYIANDQGVTKVLNVLAEYQKTSSSFFDFPVINIAKPARHAGKLMRGVAVATEPGDFQTIAPINKRNPSFGDFWDRLISPSLAEAKSEVLFFESVLKTMKGLGIDPKSPYKFLKK